MLKLGPDVLFQSFQALKNTGMLPLILSVLEKSGVDVSTIPGLANIPKQNGHPYDAQSKVPATVTAGAGQPTHDS